MDMELKTSGTLPAGVTLQGVPKPEAKVETSAAAAGSEKPTGSPGGSAKPAGTGSPAEGGEAKPEKPGRAAAAAKKATRLAEGKAKEAETKTAKAEEITIEAAKYSEAIKSGDPDKILAAFGLDDEKLVDLYIAKHGAKEPGEEGGGESAAEIKALRAELATFKEELAAEKVKGEEKRQAEAGQAAVRGHVDSIKAVAAKPEHAEKFEVCNAEPSVIRSLTGGEYESAALLAFDVMLAVHKESGEFISNEKALELTEAHLLKAHEALTGGLGKIKKFGGAPAAKTEEKKAEEKKVEAAAGGGDALASMREKFKLSRPRVTNGLAVIHPAASTSAKGVTAANQRFRERILALQQAQKTN